MEECHGITTLIVQNLGQPALVVNTSGPKLLLLDADLEHEERMRIMRRFLRPEVA